MGEIIVSAVQGLCIFGLLCGAYWSITYEAADRTPPNVARDEPFDTFTAHTWRVASGAIRHGPH